MNFRIGQTVRVNAGQWYGKLARVVCVREDSVDVELCRVGPALTFSPFDLLDSHANNGD